MLKKLCLSIALISEVWPVVAAQADNTPEISAPDVSSCVTLSGDAKQGGLLWGQVPAGVAVSIGERELLVLPDGQFLFGLGRDNDAAVTLKLSGAVECEQRVAVSPREYKISVIEGVPQRTVTPPEEDLARIAEEHARVRAAKAQRLERPDLLQAAKNGFAWPVTGRISGVYGSQRVYNGTPGNPHYGVDVAVPTGTPVAAPTPGVITLAEDDLYYSGGTVILDHGYGLSSSFLHMSKVLVKAGDEVKAGDIIGEVGATGRATGPHLDWRMSWFNERIDPQLLVPTMPKAP